ncbi:hypothetical protein [Polymorphospora rubra]|uniref:Uncharacterized protein n=1 Tax=Polymorphospora rubra TaxID=338584 RepID=A0A810N1Z0_9ACTN|nr:hypothetical protein [Polymorphospora rubra]BCJ66900.1 hypothetical protein Prubr_39210 [Polymorphospora rubra]
MRIRTIAGLAFAGAAAAAVTFGGIAYAADQRHPEPVLQIVTDAPDPDGRDCPEKAGDSAAADL